MISHTVWWTLKENAEGFSAAENAKRILEASRALKDIPTVRSVRVSTAVQPTTTVAAQVVLHSTHDTPEALQAYAVHPVHQEFGKLIKAVCENRQALDYLTD